MRYAISADLHGFETFIDSLINRLVPESAAPSVFQAIAGPTSSQSVYPANVTISQQVINAMEYTVVQNVQGNLHMGAKAHELFDLIDRFGGQDALLLKSAVYEVEDKNAPATSRKKAKEKIMAFLGQLGGKVEEVAIGVLEKYIESRLGL